MRGINDDEIEDFARLTLEHPWHVRFIELMPVGEMRELTWEHVVPSDEVLARVATRRRRSTPTTGRRAGNGPAAYYRFAGARGTIGVITPMTHTYCGSVQSRAPHRGRPAAHVPVRRPRGGSARRRCAPAMPLEPFFRQALADKPKEHALLQMQVGGLRALSQVGG